MLAPSHQLWSYHKSAAIHHNGFPNIYYRDVAFFTEIRNLWVLAVNLFGKQDIWFSSQFDVTAHNHTIIPTPTSQVRFLIPLPVSRLYRNYHDNRDVSIIRKFYYLWITASNRDRQFPINGCAVYSENILWNRQGLISGAHTNTPMPIDQKGKQRDSMIVSVWICIVFEFLIYRLVANTCRVELWGTAILDRFCRRWKPGIFRLYRKVTVQYRKIKVDLVTPT